MKDSHSFDPGSNPGTSTKYHGMLYGLRIDLEPVPKPFFQLSKKPLQAFLMQSHFWPIKIAAQPTKENLSGMVSVSKYSIVSSSYSINSVASNNSDCGESDLYVMIIPSNNTVEGRPSLNLRMWNTGWSLEPIGYISGIGGRGLKK